MTGIAVDVVDTTGAGDAMTGALAHRPARSDDLVTAVRYVVRVGAAAVRGADAQSAYPTEGVDLAGLRPRRCPWWKAIHHGRPRRVRPESGYRAAVTGSVQRPLLFLDVDFTDRR
ncbi:PfkB family carbohydrate kinase [Streptomyces atratus]|uniref:PfkB family carbohydrate kinase n=1 Tax=Streptomyces atratus TaxID=1893 RepID=UPI0034018EBE